MLYLLSMIFVLGWGFMTSLKPYDEFASPGNNVVGLPWSITFDNYLQVFEKLSFRVTGAETSYWSNGTFVKGHTFTVDIGGLIYDTLIYSIVGALIQAIVPAIMGYICAKYKNAVTKVIYVVMLFVMSLPIVGSYPSSLTLLRDLGLYDSMLGNFVQRFNFTGMYFFVFVAMFEGISDTYCEAAEIDGASQFVVMVRIMMPLAAKTISTVWLIKFIEYWNDYQTVLLYLPSYPTLAYSVWSIVIGGRSTETQLNYVTQHVAACMILAVPTFVVFIALKDKIMGNISAGGIKG